MLFDARTCFLRSLHKLSKPLWVLMLRFSDTSFSLEADCATELRPKGGKPYLALTLTIPVIQVEAVIQVAVIPVSVNKNTQLL